MWLDVLSLKVLPRLSLSKARNLFNIGQTLSESRDWVYMYLDKSQGFYSGGTHTFAVQLNIKGQNKLRV